MSFTDRVQARRPFHERCGHTLSGPPGSYADQLREHYQALGTKPEPPSLLTAPSYYDYAGAMQAIIQAPNSIPFISKMLDFKSLVREIVYYYPAFLSPQIKSDLKHFERNLDEALVKGREISFPDSLGLYKAGMLKAYCYVEQNIMPILIGEKSRETYSEQKGAAYPNYARLMQTCMNATVDESVRQKCVQSALASMQALPLPELVIKELKDIAFSFPHEKSFYDVYMFSEKRVMPYIRGQLSIAIEGNGAPFMINYLDRESQR